MDPKLTVFLVLFGIYCLAGSLSADEAVVSGKVAPEECIDSDGDGFGDPDVPENDCPPDNCPEVWNPLQADYNGNGIGFPCDLEDCCGTCTGGYPGNVNCDLLGKIGLADITALIDLIYISKKEVNPCLLSYLILPKEKPPSWEGGFLILYVVNHRVQRRRVTSLSSDRDPLDRDILNDLARLHAGGTDRYPFRNAVIKNPDPLQIWHPAPLGRVLGVRNVIARHGGLAANFTNLGHY